MGIGEKTTKDGLVSFMEVVSGEEVESIFFGSNSNAMVTFKEPPDIDKLQTKCSTRAIDGSHLKIEQVNICDCIEVTGLAPNTTKDTVFYYFDNPRNGGGEVKSVEMDSDDTRALVFFEDPSVIDVVVKRDHRINNAKLKAVPYYPFLVESSVEPGGGKKERVAKEDPQTMEIINKFYREEFDQLLQECRVKYTWQQGSGEIVLGCADPKMDKKTWENSCEAVVAYIKQIVTQKITVSKEVWKDVFEKGKEKCASFRDQIAVTCKEKERSFTLTGKESIVSVLAEQLNDLKSEIQKQIEFEKKNISKSISLFETEIELLSSSTGFVEELQARCGKDLEVKFSKKDGTINFRGPDTVVKEGNITVWQTMSKVKEMDMELPKSIVNIVGSQPGKVFLATKFKNKQIDAVVSSDPNSDNQLLVTAIDRNDAKKAVALINDLTSEQSIHLDDHQKQLIHSEKWKQLKQSIQQSMLLQVREEPATSTLLIVGIKEEVDKAKENVDGFFEENIILEKVIGAENGRLKFIFKYQKDAIQNVEKYFTNQSVKIFKKTDKNNEVIALVVSGTRDGMQQAVPRVQKIMNDIKDRKVELNKPVMKKLFKGKGITHLSVVENDNDCIIEQCTSIDIKEKYPEKGWRKVYKKSAKLFRRCATSEGEKISMYKGDRTGNKVDAKVNAVNESWIVGFPRKVETKSGDDAKAKGRRRRRKRGRGQANEPVRHEPATSLNSESAVGYHDPNSLTTAQGMNILVVVGDLAKEEAHVIVNTVGPGLDLNRSSCAKALSDAAGPQLQQECIKSGRLEVGKILVTDGYNLGCKNVFHVIAGDWKNGEGEKLLRFLLQICLEGAEDRGFSSIAFPAIGTGNLSYPRDVVAKAFFEEAETFKSKNPQNPLNEIHFVLFHKDLPTIQAFQDELKSRRPKVAKSKRRRFVSRNEDNEEFVKSLTSKEPTESFVSISQVDVSGSPYNGCVRLEIVTGDITKETTDAIVTVSNPSLNVSFGGGVGAAIAKAGGPTIQQECNKLGPQKPGSVVVTKAGTLQTKRIFHLALVSTSFVYEGISDVMVKCFRKADSMGINSIAVPAIGTGIGGISPKDAAKALVYAIVKFSQQYPKSVNHIRIVILQEKVIQVFSCAIKEMSESISPMLATGEVRRIFGYGETVPESAYKSMTEITGNGASLSFHNEDKMWLQIYAASDRNLNKAETDIHKVITENSKTKEIIKMAVGKLLDSQRDRVMKMEVTHDVKIQIEKKINRIVIRGLAEDVSNATEDVFNILEERAEEERDRIFAELLSKNVQWYYEDGDEWEPYDVETNARIEQAHKDKKPTAVIWLQEEDQKEQQDEPTRYKIDFNAMMEKNLDTGDTARVKRRDKTEGVPLPTHWDPQPKGSDGKEVDLHVVVVDPVKHKKEYDEVKGAMQKTIPRVNIVKVERVQNPEIYKTYAVKKQKMDDKNGSNEKKLFHGTDYATCQQINYKGFNRSFCGKNATLYGKGVYFARDASYSAGYSPSDPQSGNRYMYMASVLVGEYTQGNGDMIVPPAKNKKYSSVTYDTAVNDVSNPSIFVVFHDTQNYPDYLITFK